MIRTLASLLLLGAIPASHGVQSLVPPPGVEVMRVSSPSVLHSHTIQSPVLSASGVLLVDVESGEELMAINPDEQRPMASLTKIMTALLVLEHHKLTDVVTIPTVASAVGGSTVGLKTGEHMNVNDLLRALLIPSANDVAYALAAYDGKSVSSFVKMMNERAVQLGLKNTSFANPAGLDNDLQYSTPRDMTWLTLAALRKPAFRKIVAIRSATVTSAEGTVFPLINTNEMLHISENVLGVKTGTTDNAGECLIVLFTDNGRQYLLVLLKSNDRYTDALNVMQAVHEAS